MKAEILEGHVRLQAKVEDGQTLRSHCEKI
jgi:hypothetical protein